MDSVKAQRRLAILRNSRTGKKGVITKRIARLEGMVEAGGCGRRFLREMMERLVVVYQELEQVCTEINDLLTLLDEFDELNDTENVRMNVDECVALVTEHLDSRLDEAPSSTMSARTMSWVAQLPLPTDVSESDGRVSPGSDHSSSLIDPSNIIEACVSISTSQTPVDNIEVESSGTQGVAQALGLTNTLGATSLCQNDPIELIHELHGVPPEDPSCRFNVNDDPVSGHNISGVISRDMSGLNVLALSWDETKLTTSSELVQDSECVSSPRLGRIEPLMRQPLFPQPKEHHPDIDLGILAEKPQESSQSKLKPSQEGTSPSGFAICESQRAVAPN